MASEQELAKLVVKLQAESATLHKDLQTTKGIIRRFESDTRKSIRNVNQAFKSMAGVLVGAGLGRAIVQTIRTTEVLKASLETVTGSAANAGAAFAELQQFAARTPFSLTEVTQAFVRLKALGLEPTTDLLTSFGNTASAFGKSLMQFSEAVADAITGEFERLKEFGIRASSQGENVAFTFKGVTTVVKKNADEIKAYLMAIGDSDFAGAMERRAATLDGALSNLGDSFAQLANSIGELGLTAIIRNVAEFLSNSVKDMQDFGRAVNSLYNTIFGVTGKLSALYEERIELETRLAELDNRPGGARGREAQQVDARLRQVEELIGYYEQLIEAQDIANEGGSKPIEITISGGTASDISEGELKRLQKLAEKLQQPFDKLQTELRDLDTLLARGMISFDEYGEAVFDALEGVQDPLAETKDGFEDLKQAVEGWGQSFADTLLDAEGSMGSFAETVVRQLAKIAITRLMDPVFSGFGDFVGGGLSSAFSGFKLPGFATGGSFTVGGSGGTDSQLVAFKASPGEQVTISPPGGGMGATIAPVYNIDARGADAGAEQRIRAAMQETTARTVALIRDMKSRGSLPEFA